MALGWPARSKTWTTPGPSRHCARSRRWLGSQTAQMIYKSLRRYSRPPSEEASAIVPRGLAQRFDLETKLVRAKLVAAGVRPTRQRLDLGRLHSRVRRPAFHRRDDLRRSAGDAISALARDGLQHLERIRPMRPAARDRHLRRQALVRHQDRAAFSLLSAGHRRAVQIPGGVCRSSTSPPPKGREFRRSTSSSASSCLERSRRGGVGRLAYPHSPAIPE